jgi:hypothetical protein
MKYGEGDMSGPEDALKRGEQGTETAEKGGGRGRWRMIPDLVRNNWRLAGTLLLLSTIAFMYQWIIIAVENAHEQMRIQRKLLTAQAAGLVEGKNEALLRLTATSLSWAVRDELAAGNLGVIDRYFNHLVKQDRFRVILLVRSDGTVAVSTDKRMEGFPVDRFYNNSVLRQDRPEVRTLPDGTLMAVAPVMGVAAKLGVLILVYTPEIVTLDAAGVGR